MLGLGNGTWSNTGYSFDNASNVSLGYNGSYKSLNTALDGYINIPEIILKGNTNTWGDQIAANFNAYMNGTFSFIDNHPGTTTTVAGVFQSGSTIVDKGLKNWNASSSITKSKVFAETISTKLPVSAKFLEGASTFLTWGGRVVGAVGIANTLYQMRIGNVSNSRGAVDFTMGVAGFFPVTAPVSLIYFGVIALYEYQTGNKFLSKDEYY